MDKFAGKTLDGFTKELASSEAVPGGGGAAALAGALDASLGGMVCALSEGKKSCAAHAPYIAEAAEKLERIRKYMLHLIDEDGKAFQPLKKYFSLPKDDPERQAHMDSALRVACYIPTEVMYTAAEAAEILAGLAEKGVKGAISDVGVGIVMCRAAMRASELNILINAAGMRDEVFAMTLRRECELVFEKYDPIMDAALSAVKGRF